MKNRLLALFEKHHINSLCFIDVGAKGQLDFLPALAPITDITGFEPNPAELDLLQQKYRKNDFKSLHLFHHCLSDQDGDVSFNVTRHSAMSSVLDTDLANYHKHFGLYENFEGWKSNIAIDNVITAPSTRLDAFMADKNGTIDYLKIDTQGSELKILQGAEKGLNEKRINILKVEVSTIAVYRDQALFSDIDVYLRAKGYILVDLITYRNSYTPVFGRNQHKSKHYSPCGDAIYVLDPDYLTDKNKLKSGFLLLWLGYSSFGSYLITASGVSDSELQFLTNHDFISVAEKCKRLLINLCPPFLLHWFKG